MFTETEIYRQVLSTFDSRIKNRRVEANLPFKIIVCTHIYVFINIYMYMYIYIYMQI